MKPVTLNSLNMFQEMLQIFAAKFQYYNPAFMLKEFSSIK
jgi:hypothetical protein